MLFHETTKFFQEKHSCRCKFTKKRLAVSKKLSIFANGYNKTGNRVPTLRKMSEFLVFSIPSK